MLPVLPQCSFCLLIYVKISMIKNNWHFTSLSKHYIWAFTTFYANQSIWVVIALSSLYFASTSSNTNSEVMQEDWFPIQSWSCKRNVTVCIPSHAEWMIKRKNEKIKYIKPPYTSGFWCVSYTKIFKVYSKTTTFIKFKDHTCLDLYSN